MRWLAAFVIAVTAACAPNSAIVSDLSEDRAVIQVTGNSIDLADREAEAACGLHKRFARRLSFRCADAYCTRREVLYACTVDGPTYPAGLGGGVSIVR